MLGYTVSAKEPALGSRKQDNRYSLYLNKKHISLLILCGLIIVIHTAIAVPDYFDVSDDSMDKSRRAGEYCLLRKINKMTH